MKIPREHYRFILGQKGKKLAELELETATKILIPRQEDTSEEIRIVGNKEGLDKAMHEIQLISDEQVSLSQNADVGLSYLIIGAHCLTQFERVIFCNLLLGHYSGFSEEHRQVWSNG